MVGQDVGFIEEGVDFLADDGMFRYLAEPFELAGLEEEVGFREEVIAADISEAFTDKA